MEGARGEPLPLFVNLYECPKTALHIPAHVGQAVATVDEPRILGPNLAASAERFAVTWDNVGTSTYASSKVIPRPRRQNVVGSLERRRQDKDIVKSSLILSVEVLTVLHSSRPPSLSLSILESLHTFLRALLP